MFANKGEHVEPTLIRRVESAAGEVLYRARSATRHVVSEDTAYLITNMLSDVIQRAANNVRRLGFTAPAAGKTGTTDDVADAWFVGYTPRLAAGVWIDTTIRARSAKARSRARSRCRCGRHS